jgi:glucose/arabinose dehydrogenase
MNATYLRVVRLAALVAVVGLVILGVTARSQAGIEQPTGPQSPAAGNKAYFPIVSKPKPLRLELVPFVTGIPSETVTDIVHAGDSRLFVVLREGIVRVVYPDGTIDPKPFMDISRDVWTEDNWEQGLLGMAFHPQFPTVPYVYVAYTDIAALRIARASLDKNDPSVISRTTLVPLMILQKPPTATGASPVHNAGDLAFGPDGLLYIPVGDGGPDPYLPEGVPGDPYNHSQRRDELLGGILRIDVDPAAGRPPDCGEGFYSIPPSNPFLGTADCDEIWATGLRNPWRMAFDRQTGDLFISDVGEWRFEEINYLPAGTGGGANFGWHCYEGTFNYAATVPQFAPHCGDAANYVFPIHEYNHEQGECSVTGGFVYRGQKYPELAGKYVFIDFCSGKMWAMTREGAGWRTEQVATYPIGISTFGEDASGELYAGTWEDFYAPGDPTVEIYKVVVKP